MKRYFIGLLNAAISGVTAGLAANSIFHGTWKQDLMAVGVSAGVSAAKWFQQHPLPGSEDQPK